MDYSMHMDHSHMDRGNMGQCDMNVLFTWSSKNLCIIFRQWRINGPISFLLSLVLIVLLTAGYQGVRQVIRKYEVAHNQRLNAFDRSTASTNGVDGLPEPVTANVSDIIHAEGSLLLGGRDNRAEFARPGRITLAALYAIQVFYSLVIMLLFMTYNGMVMLAVAVGAFVGYVVFAEDTPAIISCL